MLSEQVQKGLNGQLNAELYSAYLCFSVSTYFEGMHLEGIARWVIDRAREELRHAQAYSRYLNQRGGALEFKGIEPPQGIWASPLLALDELCRHEERLSGMVDDMMSVAIAHQDHATVAFLGPMVRAQVRQESLASRLAHKMHAVCEASAGVCLLDHELSQSRSRRRG
jgi:ferritin